MEYAPEKKFIGNLWKHPKSPEFVVGNGTIEHPDGTETRIQVLRNNSKREGKRDADFKIVIDRYEKKEPTERPKLADFGNNDDMPF